MFKRTDNNANLRSNRWIFGTMLAFGVIGLIAAFVLTIEKFHLLENPDAVLSCSFNIVLNCSTVMQTPQSSLFGFPNMLIGLMAYPVVMTIAVLGLLNAQMPRWFLRSANVGFLFGAVFAYWLFFQSVYVIQVLCPWCLIVTFATTIILATMTHYSIRENIFGLDKKTHKKVLSFSEKGYGKLLVASWIVLLIALVFIKFGEALFV